MSNQGMVIDSYNAPQKGIAVRHHVNESVTIADLTITAADLNIALVLPVGMNS